MSSSRTSAPPTCPATAARTCSRSLRTTRTTTPSIHCAACLQRNYNSQHPCLQRNYNSQCPPKDRGTTTPSVHCTTCLQTDNSQHPGDHNIQSPPIDNTGTTSPRTHHC
ncbi:UNVERIFIED_CONTAM: hypothetical protein FKN15_009830 [Acipenser sinensis]